jgi:hypothetical protein
MHLFTFFKELVIIPKSFPLDNKFTVKFQVKFVSYQIQREFDYSQYFEFQISFHLTFRNLKCISHSCPNVCLQKYFSSSLMCGLLSYCQTRVDPSSSSKSSRLFQTNREAKVICPFFKFLTESCTFINYEVYLGCVGCGA